MNILAIYFYAFLNFNQFYFFKVFLSPFPYHPLPSISSPLSHSPFSFSICLYGCISSNNNKIKEKSYAVLFSLKFQKEIFQYLQIYQLIHDKATLVINNAYLFSKNNDLLTREKTETIYINILQYIYVQLNIINLRVVLLGAILSLATGIIEQKHIITAGIITIVATTSAVAFAFHYLTYFFLFQLSEFLWALLHFHKTAYKSNVILNFPPLFVFKIQRVQCLISSAKHQRATSQLRKCYESNRKHRSHYIREAYQEHLRQAAIRRIFAALPGVNPLSLAKTRQLGAR